MDDSQHEAGEAKAFELAVGALARKERTEAELRDLLARRGVAADDAESALERLIAVGELDDERFAARFAADKRELRGWGPERIREALGGRGIESRLAEQAAAGEPAADQASRAASLLSLRPGDLADEASRGRALAYLTRRGYDYEVAYEAVRLAERRAA